VFLDRERAATWLDLGARYDALLTGAVGVLAFDPPEPAAA
jgi:hypothetical protein